MILLIDVSGSMYGDRMTLAKDAASAVINTLSNSDFVGVIKFSSSAQVVYSSKIIRATISEKEAFITDIEALEANGQTNYEAAIRKGFQLLNAAESDEFGVPCVNG